MKKLLHDYDLYKASLLLIFNESKEDAENYLEKTYNIYPKDGFAGMAGAYMWIEDIRRGPYNNLHIIYIKKFDWSVDSLCTLTHELNHFVYRLLGARGLTLCSESEEAYTYYFEYWFRKVLVYLLRDKEKRKEGGVVVKK